MTRASLRRRVAAELKTIKDNVELLRGTWGGRHISEIFDPENGAARYSGHWRKRLPHEYPENQADAWDRLARWADHISSQAISLRDFARARRDELKGPDA